MFDRVVLRAMRRVVGHANRDAEPIDQPLQVFLEDVMSRVVAASAVAQEQNRLGPGVGPDAVSSPPQLEAVARELAGVVTGGERL